jgi:two-component system, chemotaxis family, CheB/CheR fusion protein
MRLVAAFTNPVVQTLVSPRPLASLVKAPHRQKVSEADATDKEASKSKVQAARTSRTPQPDAPSKRAAVGFPIVGVGASAGGLEAFTQLLKHLPVDTGMGFVLVQHLDPAHESALTQLLSRVTSMPVREVTDKLRVKPNHVYVIPPNTCMGIAKGVLKLRPRQEQGRTPHHSVNFFFEALAQDQRERAIGVILSGTASDGTLGLEAIKAEGGISFAQDESAKYDSMPRNAIAAGCVDFVLSPEKIAKELARIAKHPYIMSAPGQSDPALHSEAEREADQRSGREIPLAPGGHGSPRTGSMRARAEAEQAGPRSVEEHGFKNILLLLGNHCGVDFSLYKINTIQRRVTRRMVLNRSNALDHYAGFLKGNAKELDALYSDLLISVTSFFRNPEAFEMLKRKVFPKLISERREESLRVWVLGCSTGQEAYSLAMAFTEFSDRVPRAPKLQIFATDLNGGLLEKARAGLYVKSLVADLSPERLRRFFTEEGDGYRICKPLRDAVVFAQQNLLSDPPFSRMDLIACRNLLIYLEPSLQKKVLPTFHYALKPKGCLFLGASESVGAFTDLFEPVDKKHKIYSKKPGPTLALGMHLGPRHPAETNDIRAATPAGAPEGFHVALNAQREADRVTRTRYAPPGVLVNAELQVVEFRGETSPYLKPPTGQASFSVLKMAREGLMLPLRAALNKAKKGNTVVRGENVRLNQDGQSRTVHFEVVPLKNLKEWCYLIFFEEAEKVTRAVPIGPPPKPTEPRGGLRSARPPAKEESRRIAELERELAETRDYLQSIQEQSEAANEELQASNEEVTSANEELQSLNEELETSKEELESANEELTTVNEEMANRNTELNRLNSDLVNFQNSAHLSIVLLGRDLTIRRFSAQAGKQFNLLATDIGRPIGNVRHNLDLPDLETLIAEVLVSVRERERERELQDRQGHWYSLRVRPYMTLDNKVDGAVLALVDIDTLKRTEQAIAAARDFAENTIETVREPLLVLDGELRVESANRSFYRVFRVAPAETIGRSIFDLGNRQWNIPRLRTLLEEILLQHTTLEDFDVEHTFEQLGRLSILLNARRIEDPARNTQRILLAIEDITERQAHQQELQRAREYAEAIIRTVPDALVILNADLRVHSANDAFYRTFNVSPADTEGRSMFELHHGSWNIPRLRQLLEDIIPRNSFFNDFEVTYELERIGRRTLLFNARMLSHTSGQPARILLGIQDITEALQFQIAAREGAEKFKLLFERSPLPKWAFELETLRFVEVNEAAVQLYGYSRDEFLRMSVLDVRTPEAGEALKAALACPPYRLSERDTCQHRKKSGEVIDVEVRSSEITLAGKRVWLASINDITERKRAEEKLARFAEALEERVRERTQELQEANAALTRQAEELIRSNADLERFAYISSHDLQEPLRTMSSFTQLLVKRYRGKLDADADEFIGFVVNGSNRMQQLIKDLLAYSRVGPREKRVEEVDFEALWPRATADLETEIDNSRAVLTHDPLPTVWGDAVQLGQVLQNLLANALKFRGPEPPRIHVSAKLTSVDPNPASKGVTEWVFSVSDNGIGIEPQYAERIFVLFQRLHTQADYAGTGIGLAICKRAVEAHGGRIWLEPQPGRGSTFRFTIPVKTSPENSSQPVSV